MRTPFKIEYSAFPPINAFLAESERLDPECLKHHHPGIKTEACMWPLRQDEQTNISGFRGFSA